MADRVTDDMVHGFLIWARNYKEIESFSQVANSGRKWRIRIAQPVSANGKQKDIGWLDGDVVPTEFVLTSREAYVFGYGLAVAGTLSGSRAEFAAREWGWDRPK